MWEEGNTRVNRTFFDKIKDSKSISLDKDEYDVFGDGSVDPQSGARPFARPSGDGAQSAEDGPHHGRRRLYHYPQERTLHRPPPDTEFNVQQSAASRVMIEEYLKKTKTEIWIEHDFVREREVEEVAGVLRVVPGLGPSLGLSLGV